VTPLGMNPFFWVAAGLAVWILWRLLRRESGRRRLSLRSRRGTASAFGPFGATMAQFFNPGVKHVLEQELEAESQREDDDEGEPPGTNAAPRRGTDQPERDSKSSHRA
jgi:hypothetical protein